MASPNIPPKIPLLLVATFLSASGPSFAEAVHTSPLGYAKITCLRNSDTIVGVPFRIQGSVTTILSANPTTAQNGETATLTFSQTSLPPLNSHYMKFNGGTRDGRWFDIIANTANSITISLNGDNLTGVVSGNSIVIAQYWTLDTLFPPAQATTSWTLDSATGNQVPNGHAIVASATALLMERKTELLLPNVTGTGVSRLPGTPHYVTANTWRLQGVSGSYGSQTLFPDSYFIVRHKSSVPHPTVFRSVGEVEMKNFTIPLATNISGSRDTYIAIPRPIDIRLDQLNLAGTDAFVTSDGAFLSQRRDQLLVFDNSANQISKIPSAAYYFTGGNWRISGNSDPQNHVVIRAGSGLVIRKYQTPGGTTSFWNNTPSYTNLR